MEIYREDRGQKLEERNRWKHLGITGNIWKQIALTIVNLEQQLAKGYIPRRGFLSDCAEKS
ncbi:hypothetical protein DMA11_08825 [Marinilabiliaceae bacterium JC017]|nr:hypothetical protein DMA11_08825 [Marinilabiliaceae bacterium JC017]